MYEQVLGERFAELPAPLRRYFGPIPPGHVGRGVGTYEVVGPTRRGLGPILRVLAAHDVLFPERGADVPFEVANRSDADGTLRAVRTFRLPGRERRMVDAMRAERGALVDRLGRRGGLEVVLDAAIVEGGLLLTSRRLAWRLGRLRIPLPPLARVTVDERLDRSGRQRVDVRLRVALLGEAFRYAGAFHYRLEPEADAAEA